MGRKDIGYSAYAHVIIDFNMIKNVFTFWLNVRGVNMYKHVLKIRSKCSDIYLVKDVCACLLHFGKLHNMNILNLWTCISICYVLVK